MTRVQPRWPSWRRLLGLLAIPVLVLGLAACDDDDDDGPEAQLRAVHASPDAPPVNLTIDGRDIAGPLAFANATDYVGVDAGTAIPTSLTVDADGGTETVLDTTIAIASGSRNTLIALDEAANLDALLVTDDFPTPAEGNLSVRVIHAAADVGAVDVFVTAADVPLSEAGSPALAEVPFKAVGPFLELAEGEYRLRVTGAGGQSLLYDSGAVPLSAGAQINLVAINSTSSGSVELLALFGDGTSGLLADSAPQAELRALHASPDAPNVDVLVNGADALTDVPYQTGSQFLPIRAGDTRIQVNAAGTSNTVIDATVPFDAGERRTVIAVDTLANIEPLVVDEPTEPPMAGMIDLNIVHASPSAGAVDIYLTGPNDALTSTDPLSVGFKDVTAEPLALQAGDYRIRVTPPGSTNVIFDSRTVSIPEGSQWTVVAVDSIVDTSLVQLVVLTGDPTQPSLVVSDPGPTSQLRALHASPDAPAVSLEIAGEPVAGPIGFPDASGYVDVPAGDAVAAAVTVEQAGQSVPVLETTLDLDPDVRYSLVVLNEAANLEAVLVADPFPEPVAGSLSVRVIHGAVSAGEVDVYVTAPGTPLGDAGAPVLAGVPFSAVSDPLELAAGDYQIRVTPAGNAEILYDSGPISLGAGDEINLVAVDGPVGLDVQALFGDGTNALLANTFTQGAVRVVHASPDAPPVSLAVDGQEVAGPLAFGNASGYLELTAGDAIPVALTVDGSPVLETDIAIEPGTQNTLVALNDVANLDTRLIADDFPEPTQGNLAVRVIHAAASVATVDVYVDAPDVPIGEAGPPVLEDVPFNTVGPFLEIPAGGYRLRVTEADTLSLLYDSGAIDLAAGSLINLVAIDGAASAVDLLALFGDGTSALLGDSAPEGAVRVLHASPDAPNVDVLANDSAVLTDVPYQTGSAFLPIRAGENNLKVNAAGTDTTVIDADLVFERDQRLTVIAVDFLENIAPLLVDEPTETPMAGMIDLNVVHASPSAGPVDVYLTAPDAPLTGTSPLSVDFQDVTEAPLSLAAGDYRIRITVAGDTGVVFDSGPVSIPDGSQWTVVATDSTEAGAPVQLAVLTGDPQQPTVLLSDVTEPPAPTSAIRAVHASPDAPAVSLEIAGTEVAGPISFGGATDYATVAAGVGIAAAITIDDGGTPVPVLQTTLDLDPDIRYSLIALNEAAALEAVLLADDFPEPAADALTVRVIHGAVGVGAVDVYVTAPDVALGEAAAPVLEDVSFTAVSDFLELAEGSYQIRVTAAGTQDLLYDSGPIDLTAGSEINLVAIDGTGTGALDVQALFGDGTNALLGDANPEAGLRVLHASPDAPAVDVLVNDTPVLTDVPFKTASGFLPIRAGAQNLKVNAAGTDTTVIDATLLFEAEQRITVIAADVLANIEPLVLIEPAVEPMAGMVDLSVVHASPAAGPVDIYLTAPDATLEATAPLSLDFKASTEQPLAIPAGDYRIRITPRDTTDVVYDSGLVTIPEGSQWTAVAVDNGGQSPVELIVLTNDNGGDSLSVADARSRLRALHASPDAPLVDVLVEGTAVLEDIAFTQSSGYLEVFEGDSVAVTPADGTSELLSLTVPERGTDFTLLAIGFVSELDALLTVDDNSVPAAGEARLKVIHASPDAPNVDVFINGSLTIENLAFGEVADAIDVAADTYLVQISQTGTSAGEAVLTQEVTLEAGTVYTAVAANALSVIELIVLAFTP
mgnify:CR=1 FL=1